MQEQLLVVLVVVVCFRLKRSTIEGKIGDLLGHHVLAEDFVPNRLILVQDVLKVLLCCVVT